MARKTHGMTKTRLYMVWQNMRNRCNRSNVPNYYLYGGRGIRVCHEWADYFIVFRDWALAHGYSDNLSIERIDNNGHYKPNNCRFATRKEQANNKRNNSLIAINGKKQTMAQWVDETGLKQATFWQRVVKYGDAGDKAIREPRKSENIKLTINDVTMSLKDWSRLTGIKYQTLWRRIKRDGLEGADVLKPLKGRYLA